jgi:general secretion pathway protein D
LTVETLQNEVAQLVGEFFRSAGVDLSQPGRSVFWNDRLGMLLVRATLQELDVIEQAVQILNMAPPQVTIEAKFAEVTQDDTRALGFDWWIGNWLVRNDAIGIQGGTAPSFIGRSSAANPLGVFPGPSGIVGAGAIAPSATDNILSSGLRNSAPALASITGILTDPQFRLVIKALDQRTGVDLVVAPKVTTLSGRQTQVKVVDVRYIVTDLSLDSTSGSGGFFQ